jgi:hypothetical protein
MIKTEELSNPQSCMSRAKYDEMTFVLLGRDAAAPVAILAWIDERIRLGKNKPDDPQIREAFEAINKMNNYRIIHAPDRTAQPQAQDQMPVCISPEPASVAVHQEFPRGGRFALDASDFLTADITERALGVIEAEEERIVAEQKGGYVREFNGMGWTDEPAAPSGGQTSTRTDSQESPAGEHLVAAALLPGLERAADRRVKIEAFRALGDNWNSYGCPAFSVASIEAALKLEPFIPAEFSSVVPCGDGGVMFSNGGEETTIEVYSDDAEISRLKGEGSDHE